MPLYWTEISFLTAHILWSILAPGLLTPELQWRDPLRMWLPAPLGPFLMR